MIVRLTSTYEDYKKKFNSKGFKFSNTEDIYFCYWYRVKDETGYAYESETPYTINKDEDTTIPDSVANSTEFQKLFTLGFLTEIT